MYSLIMLDLDFLPIGLGVSIHFEFLQIGAMDHPSSPQTFKIQDLFASFDFELRQNLILKNPHSIKYFKSSFCAVLHELFENLFVECEVAPTNEDD